VSGRQRQSRSADVIDRGIHCRLSAQHVEDLPLADRQAQREDADDDTIHVRQHRAMTMPA
jgi:hypothetical protein